MQGLRNMLLQEQKHLQEIADKARMGMSVEPEGHLRISRDKNKPRYYQCIDGNNEIYIPRSNKELPKLLAQSTYNRTVLKKVETRLKQIKKILQDYTDDEIERIYTSMHKERQLLVTPIEPTWNQLLMKWYEEEYQGKEFKEGIPVILTEKGERVRSKSENPDFTLLSRKTGKEIYWEHEGMMDDQEYARKAIQKIESYQMNDIYQADRLILTFETKQCVLNSKIIENLTARYLFEMI